MERERTILDDILATVRAVERKVDAMSEVPAEVQNAVSALPQTGQQVVALIVQLRAENAALKAQLAPLADLNTQLQAALQTQPAPVAPEPQQPAIDPNTGQPVPQPV